MGYVPPPAPWLPPKPPARPVRHRLGLDVTDREQAMAYHVFEAQREVATWFTGAPYTPIPPERLAFVDGRILMFPDLEAKIAALGCAE